MPGGGVGKERSRKAVLVELLFLFSIIIIPLLFILMCIVVVIDQKNVYLGRMCFPT